MNGPPPVLIVVRRGEDPRQCTVRPLRGTPTRLSSLPLAAETGSVLPPAAGPRRPPLTRADAGRPLLPLDASWRHAGKMRRAVEPVEARSIPPGWRTAYPRRSKIHDDPDTGLATVEALYAAGQILGFRDDSLLRHYPWRDAFLDLNRDRPPLPESPSPSASRP